MARAIDPEQRADDDGSNDGPASTLGADVGRSSKAKG